MAINNLLRPYPKSNQFYVGQFFVLVKSFPFDVINAFNEYFTGIADVLDLLRFVTPRYKSFVGSPTNPTKISMDTIIVQNHGMSLYPCSLFCLQIDIR